MKLKMIPLTIKQKRMFLVLTYIYNSFNFMSIFVLRHRFK